MANIRAVEGEERERLLREGYTPTFVWFIEYEDGRLVEVPPARYKDSILAERRFKTAYDQISDREEVISWMMWTRLHRHDDKNEHPVGSYDDWLDQVARPVLECRVDLDQDPETLVPLPPNPPDGN